ncbi:MAG: hypothetical protein U0804_11335 [Gemmataceae bacterium]
MTDPNLPPRPVPRWLHLWAVATVCACLALLAVGQLVTSFRVGMADPIWPTSPWHLVNNYEPSPGYLIEHAHRILGFLVGGLVTVLALALWATHPNRAARVVGLLALVVLVGAFGEFHRALIAQRDSTATVTVPVPVVAAMLGALALVGLLAGFGSAAGVRGAEARALGLIALVFVMIQGLLGGFRVKLNELVGTDLAAVHGVFGQVTFAVLLTVAVLTARPPAGDVPDADRRRLGRLALGLVAVLFVQLTFGAWVRHAPDALGQRLHFLTAFVAVATAVWLLRLGFGGPARPRVRVWGTALGVLVALQVTLGVEAWMGKFGRAALPEFETVTAKQAGIRTAHALVGTGVLAAAVGLALRVRAGGER